MRLKNVISAFIQSVCAGKENETPQSYQVKLNRLVDYFEDCPISQLNAKSIVAWRDWFVSRPLSPFTRRGVIVIVRYFLRWCVAERKLKVDLSPLLPVPGVPRQAPRAISQSDFERLLDAARRQSVIEAARDVAIILCLRDTGGRVGGLAGARLEDLELEAGRLLVTEKGDKSRLLFLNAPTVAALRSWLAMRSQFKPVNSGLFVGRYGQAMTRGGIYSMLRRLALAAGVQGRFNPHSFRHALARDMILAGCDLSRVSRILGHCNVRVTAESYAVWVDAELQTAHEQFSPVQ